MIQSLNMQADFQYDQFHQQKIKHQAFYDNLKKEYVIFKFNLQHTLVNNLLLEEHGKVC